MGSIDLRPENSDNANLNISYTRRFGAHSIYAEGSLIYRDTKDYIMRRTDTQNGGRTYASYENHGRVGTKGFNISLRYSWSHWLSIGGTFTDMDVRNNERYVAGGTLQESLTYKARIPNSYLPMQEAREAARSTSVSSLRHSFRTVPGLRYMTTMPSLTPSY